MSVKLEGWKELDAKLARLPRATAGNVLVRTLIKAGQPMKEEMVKLAPDDPRTGGYDLHTSISLKRAKGSRYDTTFRRTVDVGPFLVRERGPTGKEGGRWFAAKAFELGLGDMPLRPFVRPAFDATANEVVGNIASELGAEIEKAAGRLAKKGRL